MINQQKLQEVLRAYKAQFATHFAKEKFKWEAVQHFQTHWDIEAPDFAGMFKQATDKTENLLVSVNHFPRQMIHLYAIDDPETVRDMFWKLFDERQPLVQRIHEFKKRADHLQVTLRNPERVSYQATNPISTYLWLRYPDKYYIYKFSEFLAVSQRLECDFVPKRGDNNRNITHGFRMYDEMTTLIAKDHELVRLLRNTLTTDCYPDPQFRTLTVDVGFFISKYFSANVIPTVTRPVTTPVTEPLARSPQPDASPHPYQFAIEKHLEEFIIRNWQHTIIGRDHDLYPNGQQYPTDMGTIDILATSKDQKTLLVIELKKGRGSDATVGQLLRNMSYIKETLAQPGQHVHGAIVSFAEDKSMRRAISMVPSVKYYRYQMHFDLVEQF